MRTPRRSRPTSLSRFTPIAAALASVLAAQAAFGACTTAGTGPLCVTKLVDDGLLGSLSFAVNDANTNCTTVQNPVIEFDLPGAGPFTFNLPSSGIAFNCASTTTPFSPSINGSSQLNSTLNTDSLGFNAINQISFSGGGNAFSGVHHDSALAYGGRLTVKGIDFRDFYYTSYGGPCSSFAPAALSGPVTVVGSRFENSCYGVIFEEEDADGQQNPGQVFSPSLIGGPALADRNAFGGIYLDAIINTSYGGSATIENNFVGTLNGMTSGGGTGKGIYLYGDGPKLVYGNVISGNNGPAGIYLYVAANTTIENNKIGPAVNGTTLGNAQDGILTDSTYDVLIRDNLIAFNGRDGVNVFNGMGVEITGNEIFLNGRKSINLGNAATPLLNDTGDTDEGANSLQNFPQITSVIKNPPGEPGKTKIFWTFDSTPATEFTFQFFSNPGATAMPQATTRIGNATVFTPGASSFTSGSTSIDGMHDFVSATAINVPSGDTSEVGAAVVARGVDLTPATLNFGNIVVGASSGTLSATLSSIGSGSATINQISGSSLCYGGPTPICGGSQFSCTTTCATGTFSGGASCAFTASFSPIALGPQTTTVYICDDAGGNPARELQITGTAVPPPPPVISPVSHDFGPVVLGTSSGIQQFTVTNPSPTTITLTPFASSGPFQVTSSTCASTLGPSGTCVVNIQYTPVALGASSATVSSTASSGSVSAGLNGTGAAPPPATISPAAHSFGGQEVNGLSANQPFTVTNPGPVPITLSPFTISAPFQIVSNSCGSSLSATTSCTVTARFAPVAVGSFNGTLASTASSGGVSATISGSGTAGPAPTLTPPNLDFGSVTVGSSSAMAPFTLTNPSLTPMPVGSFTVTGPFALGPVVCTNPLPPGASCTAQVKFAPTAVGAATGTVSVSVNGLTLSSGLAGTGSSVPVLMIGPALHDFGSVLVGQASANKTFSINNPSAAATSLSPVTATPPFQLVSTTCTTSLANNASCDAVVRFVPNTNGLFNGALTVSSSAGPSSASLAGIGVRQAAVSVPTSPIEFGSMIVGSAPVQQTIQLRSTGNTTLGINSITVSPPFTMFTTCGASLAEGDACNITVGFNPTAIGDFSGALSVSTNAPGASLLQAPVHASVQQRPEPIIQVSPRAINFGARFAGSPAPTQNVTVRNDGGSVLTLDVSLSVPHFSIVNSSCGATLAPGASCGIELGFSPQGFGPKRADLVIRGNASNGTQGVTLTGAGCRPVTFSQSRGGASVNCSP